MLNLCNAPSSAEIPLLSDKVKPKLSAAALIFILPFGVAEFRNRPKGNTGSPQLTTQLGQEFPLLSDAVIKGIHHMTAPNFTIPLATVIKQIQLLPPSPH